MGARKYQIAGHTFEVSGDALSAVVARISGFEPFRVDDRAESLFSIAEGVDVPVMDDIQYRFSYDDVQGVFGRTAVGHMLELKLTDGSALHMWVDAPDHISLKGNLTERLCRFALWIGYGLMVLPYGTVAVHSSCITHSGQAVLFLGESGTGKSTHTRLWREHLDGAVLLNDDSPIIRIEDGKVWAYGSPWSGKTPCYKQERYELKGCVRLSQAPYNKIKPLSVLQAYGAIHPSCPPEFAYDQDLYEHISQFIGKLLSKTRFFHLVCLPDREAVELSYNSVLGN